MEFIRDYGKTAIIYDGESSAIDHDLFTKAKQKALNIKMIIPKDDIVEDTSMLKEKGLLEWISEKYPKKLDTFTEAYNRALSE